MADLTGKTVEWDVTKPSGDRMRIMDTTRAESYGIKSSINLRDGIAETLQWYLKNQGAFGSRYNSLPKGITAECPSG